MSKHIPVLVKHILNCSHDPETAIDAVKAMRKLLSPDPSPSSYSSSSEEVNKEEVRANVTLAVEHQACEALLEVIRYNSDCPALLTDVSVCLNSLCVSHSACTVLVQEGGLTYLLGAYKSLLASESINQRDRSLMTAASRDYHLPSIIFQ